MAVPADLRPPVGVAAPTRLRRLPAGRTVALLVLLIAGAAILARSASSPPLTPTPGATHVVPVEGAVPSTAFLAVSRALGADEHSYWVGSGLQAENKAQGLRAHFARGGLSVHGSGFAFGLTLAATGRANELRPAAAVTPIAHANRVTYHRPGLSEWYANGPLGLEQGFTLARRTSASGRPLTLALDVKGSLRARLDGATSVLLFAGSRLRLRYTALSAFDARGRALPAQFALHGRRLLISVNDVGARYPLTIDPVVATLSPSDGGGTLGASVAVSGSMLVAGAPNANVDSGTQQPIGAAYVFVEPTSGWQNATQDAVLTPSDGTGSDSFGAAVAISQPAYAFAPATIVVGAPQGNGGTGEAYVYTEPTDGWQNTTETAALTPSDATSGDALGSSVAVGTTSTGTATVAAGAPGANNSTGAVYVYDQSQWAGNGRGPYTETEQLADPNGQQGDQLGYSVSSPGKGTTVVAGAPYANNNNGLVDVFYTSATSPVATLVGGDGGGLLGSSVSAIGQTVLAGAPSADSGKGALYVYAEPTGGWPQDGTDGTAQNAELTPSDAHTQLGSAAALAPSPGCMGALGAAGSGIYDFVPPAAGWASESDSAGLAADSTYATPYSEAVNSLTASGTYGFAGYGSVGAGGAVSVFSLKSCQTGTTGPTGPAGATGASGNTGAPGSTGAAGAAGPAGSNGSAGPNGQNGQNGQNGVGSTGPAGTNGTNGQNGQNGVGSTGPAGTNGTNGRNGTNGTNGTTVVYSVTASGVILGKATLTGCHKYYVKRKGKYAFSHEVCDLTLLLSTSKGTTKKAKVTLERRQVVYAVGTASAQSKGRTTIKLAGRRALPRGTYVLTFVSGHQTARTTIRVG